MWFQDLFNYDFRRTEMCIIPYATQQGEISFCAYNTGIGWRNIIEKMHMTATLTKWYEEHGRHEIFAGGKAVPLTSTAHSLKLNEEAVRAGAQTDLDEMGIAKNAREEKLKARSKARRTRPEPPRGNGQAVSPARPQGTADAPNPGAGRQEEAGRAAGPAQADRLVARSGVQASGFNGAGLVPGRRETVGLFRFAASLAWFARTGRAVFNLQVADDRDRPARRVVRGGPVGALNRQRLSDAHRVHAFRNRHADSFEAVGATALTPAGPAPPPIRSTTSAALRNSLSTAARPTSVCPVGTRRPRRCSGKTRDAMDLTALRNTCADYGDRRSASPARDAPEA